MVLYEDDSFIIMEIDGDIVILDCNDISKEKKKIKETKAA